MLANALGAIFNIAFDHQTLYQPLDHRVLIAAVDDILCDADLL